MKDHQVLLSSIDDLNNGETFRCAQGMNQVSSCSCDAWEMVELFESDCLVGLTPLMNDHHSW